MTANNKEEVSNLNLANIITITRILLVPIFVFVFLYPWTTLLWPSGECQFLQPAIGLGIFILLSLSDSLDGYIARSFNKVTNFGKFIDPLADKILVITAFVALVETGSLSTWVVLIVLMREFVISGMRMMCATEKVVIAASWYGKIKTVTQILAVILFLAFETLKYFNLKQLTNIVFYLSWFILIISLIFTIVSMIDYIKQSYYILNKSDNTPDNFHKIHNLSIDIVKKLSNKKLTLSTCESITCGMLCSSIGDVSGASRVYKGSLITYSYSAKSHLLNIPLEFLQNKGAVNKKCSNKMAIESKKILNSDISLSTTGVAGPQRDDFGNKVGCVFISIAFDNKIITKSFNFNGDRQQIRELTVLNSLFLLNSEIDKM